MTSISSGCVAGHLAREYCKFKGLAGPGRWRICMRTRETGSSSVVKIDSARRSGRILEVMEGPAGEHYRVRWDDGHESEFFPGLDARLVHPPS